MKMHEEKEKNMSFVMSYSPFIAIAKFSDDCGVENR
jgi:hypothetical protein